MNDPFSYKIIANQKVCVHWNYFYGVAKNEPIGEGVFMTEDKWIECGAVLDDGFTDGQKVSVN